MLGKAVVLCLERSAALFALVALLTLFGPTALAQDGGGRFTPPGGADETATAKTFAGSAVSEVARPAPPPEVGGPPPSGDAPRLVEAATVEAAPAEVKMPAANKPIFNSPLAAAALSAPTAQQLQDDRPIPISPCARIITADVVAFDQVYTYNRFGAFNPGGMMYALKRDVVAIQPDTRPGPGNAQLRHDKRPRPIVLRVNEGDCLQVTFTNWLTEKASGVEELKFDNQPDRQPYTNWPVELRQNDTTTTRTASMHVNGLDYVNGPETDDGAFVGQNANSMAKVGETKVYTWYAARQGQIGRAHV